MKRIVAAFLTIFLIAGIFTGCGSETSKLSTDALTRPEFANKTPYLELSNEEFVLAAEKGDLKLYFQPSTTQFKVENAADGSVWFSNPQDIDNDEYASRLIKMQMYATMIVGYSNTESQKEETLNMYTSVVRSQKYEIKLVDDGVLFEYKANEVGKKFYLAVRLSDDNLYTDAWYENLEETKENILISSVSVTPYFVSGRLGDDGYLFLPDGSGALVNFDTDNITADSYSRPIYGEEPTASTRDWYLQASEETVKLPVFGVLRNGSAVFAIAENGAEIGTMKANACGQVTAYANAYVSYRTLNSVQYKMGMQTTTVYDKKIKDVETFTTRYYFLTGDDANYSGMARKYRDYLAETYSLKGTTVNDTFYTDVYAGIYKKVSTFGIPHDKFVSLTTAEELEEMCKQISEIGAANITVRYKNWNKQELKGKRVSNANVSSSLSFKELSDFSGAKVYPSVDTLQSYTSGGYIDALLNSSFSTVGIPFSIDDFNKSNLQSNDTTIRWVAINKLTDNVQKYMKKLSNKGFKNIAFGDLANRLYADYRDDGYLRDYSKKIMLNLLKEADSKFEGIVSDGANDYAAVYSNVIYNTPVSHSMQDILGQSVPFYSLALGGLVDCVAPSFNGEYASDDLMLRAAASGTYFCYSFMNAESSEILSTPLKSLTNMNFESTIDDATKAYNEMKKITTAAKGSRMYSHEYITETLSVTEYENGVKVYVNFANEDAVIDSVEVPAKAFTVIGGVN